MKIYIDSPSGKERLVDAFIQTGIEIVKEISEDVKLIVPTVDETLNFFALSREWFKSKGVTVMVASENTIFHCRNKNEFAKFCRRHGFGIPDTYDFDGIVKPRFGKASKGQLRINSSYIVQEFVNWPEYSIDYYHDDIVTSIIPRERLNVVNGESTAARFENNEFLIDEARRLGKELDLQYHNVMQCFFNGTDIKWIEVNPRYGGGSWLTFDTFNSPEYIVETIKDKL